MSLRSDEIGQMRLAAQRVGSAASTPGALVRWLLAVQAQDALGARWALGARGAETEADVVAALDSGEILRTHLMRGTWQYVAPSDLRWLLALLGPRVRRSAEVRHRQLELSPRHFSRCEAALTRALEETGPLTREEVRAVLERAGVPTHEQRLSHLITDAELAGLLCSGPMKDDQPTWALLDARVPRPRRTRTRDESLAELAQRYFASRGPASLADFRWWTGLTAADATAALDAVQGRLESADVNGRTLWWAETRRKGPTGAALLLPPFDEFLIAYQERGEVLDPRHLTRVNAGGGLISAVIVSGGVVAGTWRRTLSRRHVDVVASFLPGRGASVKGLDRHVARYARFLRLEARLTIPRG